MAIEWMSPSGSGTAIELLFMCGFDCQTLVPASVSPHSIIQTIDCTEAAFAREERGFVYSNPGKRSQEKELDVSCRSTKKQFHFTSSPALNAVLCKSSLTVHHASAQF